MQSNNEVITMCAKIKYRRILKCYRQSFYEQYCKTGDAVLNGTVIIANGGLGVAPKHSTCLVGESLGGLT